MQKLFVVSERGKRTGTLCHPPSFLLAASLRMPGLLSNNHTDGVSRWGSCSTCAVVGVGAAGNGGAGAAVGELLPGAGRNMAGQGSHLKVVMEKFLLYVFALQERGCKG